MLMNLYFKKSILLLFSLIILCSCSKVDSNRDPISINNVDLNYVAKNDPDFFIQSFVIDFEDNIIGKTKKLNGIDYYWALKLLQKNKNELYQEKKPNTYLIDITFQELKWSFEYDRSKYNGKQVTFYISEKLRNLLKQEYIKRYPVNTVLSNISNKKIEGYVTISGLYNSQVLDGIRIDLYGNRKYGIEPLLKLNLIGNITVPFHKQKIIPFSINITSETLEKVENNNFRIDTTSSNGTELQDRDKFKLVK